MKKTFAAVALALFLVGCVDEPARTGARSADPSPSPTPSRSPSPSPSDETAIESPAPTPHETAGATPAPAADAIVVSEPTMDERISSPLTVEGTADVFEATVQMRLLDAQGQRLARGFATATCGSGCRGDFSHELQFTVGTEQHGVLEVWWDSPEDGSRKDVVKIQVTLAP